MWSQWGAAAPPPTVAPPLPTAPPPPPPSNPPNEPNAGATAVIGPMLPTAAEVAGVAAPTATAAPAAAGASGNPYGQYTAAQYAALTTEQQYALQQHWQQWQTYQQEYAKWHAQYGEQYKREMEAISTTAVPAIAAYPAPIVPTYPNVAQPTHLSQPPPVVGAVPAAIHQPPPQNVRLTGQPQLYVQPPPPIVNTQQPPPPNAMMGMHTMPPVQQGPPPHYQGQQPPPFNTGMPQQQHHPLQQYSNQQSTPWQQPQYNAQAQMQSFQQPPPNFQQQPPNFNQQPSHMNQPPNMNQQQNYGQFGNFTQGYPNQDRQQGAQQPSQPPSFMGSNRSADNSGNAPSNNSNNNKANNSNTNSNMNWNNDDESQSSSHNNSNFQQDCEDASRSRDMGWNSSNNENSQGSERTAPQGKPTPKKGKGQFGGPNETLNREPNTGSKEGFNRGTNNGPNEGFNRGSNEGFNRGQNEGFNRGPNSGPNEGFNRGPNDGFNRGPNNGPNEGFNRGPNDGFNRGPNSGPNEGFNRGPNDGFNRGPNSGPNEGFNRGPNEGFNRGPNSGPNEGFNRGPNTGLNDTFNRGSNCGPNDGFSRRSNNGPNDGFNRGPNEGFNRGPNSGQNDGYNRGPNSGQNDGFNRGSNDGFNRGSNESFNRGMNSGPNDGFNRGTNEGFNRGSNDNFNRGPNSGPNDGFNRGSNDGFNRGGPNDRFNRGGQNDNFNRRPNAGMTREPNSGPNEFNRGPNEGFNRGPNEGINRGPTGPNDGMNRGGPNTGFNRGPNSSSNEGFNRGPNNGPNNNRMENFNRGNRAGSNNACPNIGANNDTDGRSNRSLSAEGFHSNDDAAGSSNPFRGSASKNAPTPGNRKGAAPKAPNTKEWDSKAGTVLPGGTDARPNDRNSGSNNDSVNNRPRPNNNDSRNSAPVPQNRNRNNQPENKAKPSRWGNTGNFGNATADEDLNDQNAMNMQLNSPNIDNAAKRAGPDIDEEGFDQQFKKWEEQFDNWKRANVNHPDREMYERYEQEFEKQRMRIMERRDQLRRRKLQDLTTEQSNAPLNLEESSQADQHGSEVNKKESDRQKKQNTDSVNDRSKKPEPAKTESAEGKSKDVSADEVSLIKKDQPDGETSRSTAKEHESDNTKQLRKGAGGEPLYEYDWSKEHQRRCSSVTSNRDSNQSPQRPATSRLGKRRNEQTPDSQVAAKNTAVEVITLDDDTDDRPSCEEQVAQPMDTIFNKTSGIPGLDLVDSENSKDDTTRDPVRATAGGSNERKLASEKKKQTEGKASRNEPVDNTVADRNAELTKHIEAAGSNAIPDMQIALKDPAFMQKISDALARAQGKDKPDPGMTPPAQFLQQLPALLQTIQSQRTQESNVTSEDEKRPLSFAEWQRKKVQPQPLPVNSPRSDGYQSENNEKMKDNGPPPLMSQTFGDKRNPFTNAGPGGINFNDNDPNSGFSNNRRSGGGNFGPNFGPNGPNFGPNGPNFGPNGPNFGPNGPNFGPNGPNFGPNGPNFGPNGPNFGPNGPNFGPNGPNFGPNGANFGPNGPNFGPNGPNFGPNGPNFGPNGRNFGPNRPNFGPGCGPNGQGPNSFGGNRQGFGPNRPDFGDNGPRGFNFGDNGPRGPNRGNFGDNESRRSDSPTSGDNGPNASNRPNFGGNGPRDSNRQDFGDNGGNRPNRPDFGDDGQRGPNRQNFENDPDSDGNGPNRQIGAGPNNQQGNFNGPPNMRGNRGPNFNNNFGPNGPGGNGPNFNPGFGEQGRNNNRDNSGGRNNSPRDSWMKGPGGSGDGGKDNNFYRPMQVIDYTNSSLPTKVIDYGHKASLSSPGRAASMQPAEYKPMHTIDYGHAHQADSNTGNTTVLPGVLQPKGKNKKKKKKQKGNALSGVQQAGQNNSTTIQALPHSSKSVLSSEEWTGCNENFKLATAVSQTQNAESTVFEGDDLDEISDNDESMLENIQREESPPPPPPPMFSSNAQFTPIQGSASSAGPISLFPSTASANDNLQQSNAQHLEISLPSIENHNTISIDELLLRPGREIRSKRVCIILRGPPGSGKSYVAKMIKEKEMEIGGANPRILSIDDYFFVQNDYEEKCPKTGKKLSKTELIYEYDSTMEEKYMEFLIRSFKKTIADQLYDFIIVDCNNNSLRTLNEFYINAKDAGFMPYIVDMFCDVETCLGRNSHNRSRKDIEAVLAKWNATPFHYIKLDVTSLVENVIEMEDAEDMVTESNFNDYNEGAASCEGAEVSETMPDDNNVGDEYEQADSQEVVDEDDSNESNEATQGICGFLKSKWETDTSNANLARLDGTNRLLSKRQTTTMEDYLQVDDWQPPATTTDGKKRVRWADMEEKQAQDKMRAIGFVVGQTDWKRMMDPHAGNRALNRTKYIERVKKRH